MGQFTAAPDLEVIVGRMIAPEVRKVAQRVETIARRLAPPGKNWTSMADAAVRDTHRVAHRLPTIPDNLRFAVPGQPWDVSHGLSPGTDYLLRPKDTSTGLPPDAVQHVHCRCKLTFSPMFISKYLRTEPARVSARAVTVEVVCTAPYALQAEYGDVYPTGARAVGTHFMSRAAAAAAGNAAALHAPTDTTAAPQGGPGTGSQDNHG